MVGLWGSTKFGACGIAHAESVSLSDHNDHLVLAGRRADQNISLRLGFPFTAALVSPKDLRLAAPYLPHYALSHASAVRLRVFPSGLTILHTPHFSLASFSARILELLDLRQATVASLSEAEVLGMAEIERREREGVNVLEVARAEQLSVGLAKEMMDLLEMGEGAAAAAGGERRGGGHVVRDEQGGEGTRWHRNLISGAVWDGQVFST